MPHSILVVDDEDDIRELLALSFEKKGYTVYTAENGTKGFKAFQEHDLDVVISDVRMGGGSGIELLKSIRRVHPSKPIFYFMTGFADITKQQVYQLGAEGLIMKPFHRTEMFQRIADRLQPIEERWTLPSPVEPQAKIEMAFPSWNRLGPEGGVLLGRGGILIQAELPVLDEGVLVEFRLTFGEKDALGICFGQGRVAWLRRKKAPDKSMVGIEFTYLEPKCRAQVLAEIQRNDPSAVIPSGGE